MRRLPILLLTLLVVLPLAPTQGLADEEPKTPTLVSEIFEVGALTSGHSNFIRPGAAAEWVPNDEDHPLFGTQCEEPIYPVGQTDELIELIRTGVDPAMWERTVGADIASFGEQRLLVRAPEATLMSVRAFLAQLEQETLTPLTVELQVVRIPEDGARDAQALAGGEMIASVCVTQMPGQQSVVWEGTQHAYVNGYSVEVAKSAQVSAPRTGVANLGLLAEITARPAGGQGAVRLSVDAALATLGSTRRVQVGHERELETLTIPIFRSESDRLVELGAWTLLDTSTNAAGEQVGYMARVTRHMLAIRPRAHAHNRLTTPAFDDSGRASSRRHDVARLTAPIRHAFVSAPWTLHASNVTLPEPPEVPEPRGAILPDQIPELIMHTVGSPGTWDEPATIEIRNGILIVRNTAPVQDRTGALLQHLRRGLLRTVHLQAELVEVSSAKARALCKQGVFDATARAALLKAPDTHVAFAGQVQSTGDSRRVLTSGSTFDYVSGYDVEIAEAASVGQPIMARGFRGVSLRVWPHLNVTEDFASIEVSLARTRGGSHLRTIPTPVGDIELPSLDTTRIETTVFAPLGVTTVIGASGQGERMTVLLLTPTISRIER